MSAPDQVRCRHIICKHNKSRNPVSRRTGQPITISEEAAIEELKKIKETLTAANFAEVAEQRSDCSSFAKGGDLGFFGRGEMDGNFEAAAFKLNVGEISDVVLSSSGAHLILRIA
ncbi:unnamed protein product [Vitrella brassicaformis CCMP3155]|uniref:Peptidyl-prolyl cis-trans isomerase n=1 Tax=Vitrella brassicaformis (strain CCMP3155) TaxID=1169540 RepID=A0A0G4G8G5_VITBC|nr:unnamed protein product [Vitrella brassicaformis CCMP3155]|eukprot:CEM25089.1 unnamed protein product [Vitrella brassicaformis CCMP3155]